MICPRPCPYHTVCPDTNQYAAVATVNAAPPVCVVVGVMAHHLPYCGHFMDSTEALAFIAVANAADAAQCGCNAFMRDSGHAVGCWMPELIEALDTLKAVRSK